MVALRFFVGLCACLSLPLLLWAQWPAAPAAGLAWDLGNALGYLALAVCLLLFVYRGRPRRFPPFGGRFFAAMHRHLGYIALLLTSCHVGLLLWAEPLLLETSAKENHGCEELKQAIELAIAALPDRCRLVFVFSRYEGMSNQQIADLMEISVKTVENQMTKAFRLLRSALGHLNAE